VERWLRAATFEASPLNTRRTGPSASRDAGHARGGGPWAPPGDHVRGRRPPRGRAPAPRPLLDLGGTYGDPQAGDPIQYDELRIEHDHGDVEIVVCNRAILLFTTDSHAVRRIHEVCCRLDDIAGSHRPA